MNWEKCWRYKLSWHNERFYVGTLLDILRKGAKNLSRWPSCRVLNPGPPNFEATRPWRGTWLYIYQMWRHCSLVTSVCSGLLTAIILGSLKKNVTGNEPQQDFRLFLLPALFLLLPLWQVSPCYHSMARPQVAYGGMASNMEGSCEYIE